MKRIIPLTLATVMLLSGCGISSQQTNSKAANSNAQKNKTIFLMVGKIEAAEKADITSKIPAKVTEISVDIGSPVKKGDTIVKLDTKDIEAQVQQAQAGVDTAKANLSRSENGARSEQINQAQAAYNNAKTAYDRTKSLFDQGATSKQLLENAELALSNAQQQLNILGKDSPDNIKVFESQLNQAQAALDVAKTMLTNGTIVSPISGVVSAKNINVGEMASSAIALVSVVNPESIYINAYLPAGLVSQVKAGQEVAVKVSEIPEKEFAGVISIIDPVIDSKSKNILVKVKFKEPDSALKPGMFAQIGLKN